MSIAAVVPRLRAGAWVCGLAAALCVTTARAQTNATAPDPTQSPFFAQLAPLVQAVRLPSLADATLGLGHAVPRTAQVWPPVRPQLALQLNRDPRVTEQVRQHLLQQLLASQPEQAPKLRAALQLDWLQGFAQVFGEPYGLDASNLADVLTAYTVSLWAMVNQQPRMGRQAVQQVREHMRHALAEQPQLQQLGRQERQRMADTLVYSATLLSVQRWWWLTHQQDATLTAAAQHYHQMALDNLQLDLTALALTERGLVPKDEAVALSHRR